MPTARGIHAALSPRTLLPLCVRNATSENHPRLPSITPSAHAMPCAAEAAGTRFAIITTHTVIAAGFSTIKASPSLKPSSSSALCFTVSTTWCSGGGGGTGLLRAVR